MVTGAVAGPFVMAGSTVMRSGVAVALVTIRLAMRTIV